MSESIRVLPRVEEADMEVELSAQELLALSDCRNTDQRETGPTLAPPKRNLNAAGASTKRHISISRLSLSAIATVGIVGSAYVLTSSNIENQSTANTSLQTARSEWPPPEQFAEGELVRFANPFDADEVFEFPPGTTETDARDAVAELLRNRAMSRQRT